MPSITIARLRELEKAEKNLQQKEESKILEPFLKEFLETLGLIASTTPLEKWPKEFTMAFEATRKRGFQYAAQIYLERMKRQ